MSPAYIASRVEYLLAVYCWWCGAPRFQSTDHGRCASCGASFGPDTPAELPVHQSGTTIAFQRTLFSDAA